MNHIGIDCRFAAYNAGLGRYTRELVTHLVHLPNTNIQWTLFVQSVDEPWLQKLESTRYTLHATRFPHYSLAEQLAFPRIIKQSNIDVLFSPHFNVPVMCPVPFVVTIHDLILHRYPNQASLLKQWAYKVVMRSAIHKARSVIAVSSHTQQEILDIYGQRHATKTCIVPEAPSPHIRPASKEMQNQVLKKLGIQQPFFLYVGNAKQHKNVQLLIDAHTASGVSEPLVLVTGGNEAQQLMLSDTALLVQEVSDDILSALYSAAHCFVSASLYEGFGLPLVEAQICGCPIIACSRSAIPETAGSEAKLIEPTLEVFAEAFKAPPSPPQHFVATTWEDIAQETTKILNSKN